MTLAEYRARMALLAQLRADAVQAFENALIEAWREGDREALRQMPIEEQLRLFLGGQERVRAAFEALDRALKRCVIRRVRSESVRHALMCAELREAGFGDAEINLIGVYVKRAAPSDDDLDEAGWDVSQVNTNLCGESPRFLLPAPGADTGAEVIG